MPVRESHPIAKEDLAKYVPEAERILKIIKGKEDLLEIYKNLTPEEKYRPLPEELDLFYAIRHATCLFFYFYDLLLDRTGLKKEVEEMKTRGIPITPAIQTKAKFISTYAMFVTGSSIVARCEEMLKGKDQSKFARLDAVNFDFVVGGSVSRDLQFMFSYYVDALRSRMQDGSALIQNPGDLFSTTCDFWKAVAAKATFASKEFPRELNALVETTTFRYSSFAVTGYQAEEYKEVRVISWARVEPEEVVADQDVTKIFTRFGDRLALFDLILRKNIFVEYGGIVESIFLDGPPGTGKTTRMRMLATRIAKRAEMLGTPFVFKSLTADQVKSEWYGKTAQLMKEFLSTALDPTVLVLLAIDDIDLLIKGNRNDPSTIGSDLDISSALMNFTSGAGTNYIGNYLTVAASNKPTGIDDALRQRFVYRAVIEGPKTWEDYADLSALELCKFAKTGLLQIKPGKYEPLKRELPKQLAEIYSAELKKKYQSKKDGSWDDVGKFCMELHKKDPNFTGRPVKNAVQVAVAQTADFEVPEEWFSDPLKFRAKSWEERLAMVKTLYKPLTVDMIMMALEKQFESETRYKKENFERKVKEFKEEVAVRTAAAESKE